MKKLYLLVIPALGAAAFYAYANGYIGGKEYKTIYEFDAWISRMPNMQANYAVETCRKEYKDNLDIYLKEGWKVTRSTQVETGVGQYGPWEAVRCRGNKHLIEKCKGICF